MANFGIMAGGIASGFEQTQQNLTSQQFAQQELKLQQQAQQNAEQRFQITRIDEVRTTAMTQLADTVDKMKIANIPTPEIVKTVSGWLEAQRKLARSSGLDPAVAVDAPFAMMISRPPSTQTATAMKEAVEEPKAQRIGGGGEFSTEGPVYGIYNRKTGRFDPIPLPGEEPGVPSPQTPAPQLGKPSALAPAPGRPVTQALENMTSASPWGPVGTGATPAAAPGTFNAAFEDRAGPAALAGQPAGSAPPVQRAPLISVPLDKRQEKIIRAAGMTPEQADFMAVQHAFGNTGVTQGVRSKVGAYGANIIKARGAQYWMDRGLNPQDANAAQAEFAAMKHGAQTLATLDARMTAALSKAKATAPIVLDLSKRLPRTEYPTLNAIKQAVQKGTGNKDIIQFNIAMETLASNFGSTMGMGNSVLTDFQTQRAQKLLEMRYSEGQIEAGVAQILTEIEREEGGLRGSMRRFIGQSTEDIMGGSGGGGAPATPVAAPAATPSTPGVSGAAGGVKWKLDE